MSVDAGSSNWAVPVAAAEHVCGAMMFFFFYVYSFFEREREHKLGRNSWGGADREGDRIQTGSRLSAVSTEPDAGLELTNREIVTRAEVGRSTD